MPSPHPHIPYGPCKVGLGWEQVPSEDPSGPLSLGNPMECWEVKGLDVRKMCGAGVTGGYKTTPAGPKA